MQNEYQKFTKTTRAITLFPVTLIALIIGCAEQETIPVNAKPQLATEQVKPQTATQQQKQQAAAQVEIATPPPPPIVEQYALDRLKEMSDQLVAAKAFSYHASSSIEVQAITGQFLTFFAESDIALERPNKLRANVSGDVPEIQLYFDGAQLLAYDPAKNLYAVSEPLATVDEMSDFVLTKAHINFPSADIINSNPYAVMTRNLTHAIVVGPSQVNGISCEHFAYMEPGVNWEMWIQSGKNARPLRLAMTYKQVSNFPRFSVEFSNWNLKPKLKASLFEFKVPANATQIEFGNNLILKKLRGE